MNWFFLSILAPLLYAVVGYVDKLLINFVKKKDKESEIGALVLYSSLYGLVVSAVSYIFFDVRFDIGIFNLFILILIGFLTLLWIVFYLKALEFEDVSVVTPLYLLVPVFTYILEIFVFGFVIGLKEILAIVLILSGGLLLNLQIEKISGLKKFVVNKKVLILMTLASFLISLIGILFKYVTVPSDFWTSIFWEHFGLGLAGIFVFAFVSRYRKQFIKEIRTYGYKLFGVNILNESITVLGNLSKNFATLLVSITVVYSIETFQPVFVLLIGFILSLFFPKILKEDFSKKALLKKLIPILIMIAGSLLLIY